MFTLLAMCTPYVFMLIGSAWMAVFKNIPFPSFSSIIVVFLDVIFKFVFIINCISKLLTYMYYLLNAWNETHFVSQNKLYLPYIFLQNRIILVNIYTCIKLTICFNTKILYKFCKNVVKTLKMSMRNKHLNSTRKSCLA